MVFWMPCVAWRSGLFGLIARCHKSSPWRGQEISMRPIDLSGHQQPSFSSEDKTASRAMRWAVLTWTEGFGRGRCKATSAALVGCSEGKNFPTRVKPAGQGQRALVASITAACRVGVWQRDRAASFAAGTKRLPALCRAHRPTIKASTAEPTGMPRIGTRPMGGVDLAGCSITSPAESPARLLHPSSPIAVLSRGSMSGRKSNVHAS